MQYPQLKAAKTRSLSVGALSGGCRCRSSARLVADGQLAQAKNLWWQDGALRTRPGFRTDFDTHALVHESDVSWKFCTEDTDGGRRFLRRIQAPNSDTVSLQTGILTYDGRLVFEGGKENLPADVSGMLMEYPYTPQENVLIFLSTGEIYAQHSTTGAWRRVDEEAYVPCLQIGAIGVPRLDSAPNGSGTPYEGRNMLTGRFCAKYTTTETGRVFYLPVKDIDEDQPVTIRLEYVGGQVVTHTILPGQVDGTIFAEDKLRPRIDRKKGYFFFLADPGGVSAPQVAFANNLTVWASKSWTAAEKQRIANMSFSTWFGGSQEGCASRQFISGSPLAPNRIYWSGQGQPLYFPETNYIAVGDINQRITAFGKQDGRLVIFKEREIYSLSKPDGIVSADKVDGQLVQEVTATSEYFPLTQLHGQIGCAAPQSICLGDNRLLWADGGGSVYTLIGNRVREISAAVGSALQAYTAAVWKNASAAVYKGYYLLQIDHTVYALRIDEKAFRRYDSIQDDAAAQQRLAWFIWELPTTIRVTRLLGNGQAAVILARRPGAYGVDLAMAAVPDAPDTVPAAQAWEDAEIQSEFCTKAYDFGFPHSRKRILRVHIGIQAAKNAAAHFSYLCDETRSDDAVALRVTPTDGIFSLTPNCARVRRFGCAMKATGTVAVDSITITYRC